MGRVAGLHAVERRLVHQPLTLRERGDGALVEEAFLFECRQGPIGS
jgi:hypothetical protein